MGYPADQVAEVRQQVLLPKAASFERLRHSILQLLIVSQVAKSSNISESLDKHEEIPTCPPYPVIS